MKEGVSHFLEHLRGLGGIRATAFSGIVALTLYLGGRLFDAHEEQLYATLRIEPSFLVPMGLSSVLVAGAAFLANEWGRSRKRSQMPTYDEVFFTDIQPIPHRTPELAEAVNHLLIPNLFASPLNPLGAETMAYEEIDKVGAINRYTAVGVSADCKIVGYASFWPLKSDIAQKVLDGEISDSDLTAEHVLPESARHMARYAIIPGFGVLHPRRETRSRAAVVLFSTLKRMVAQQYFSGDRRRSLTLIALPYSKAGRDWCRALGLTPNGSTVSYADGTVAPVSIRTVQLSDLL